MHQTPPLRPGTHLGPASLPSLPRFMLLSMVDVAYDRHVEHTERVTDIVESEGIPINLCTLSLSRRQLE